MAEKMRQKHHLKQLFHAVSVASIRLILKAEGSDLFFNRA
jgi:hypothetical protein